MKFFYTYILSIVYCFSGVIVCILAFSMVDRGFDLYSCLPSTSRSGCGLPKIIKQKYITSTSEHAVKLFSFLKRLLCSTLHFYKM
jgi:hypothetical protein